MSPNSSAGPLNTLVNNAPKPSASSNSSLGAAGPLSGDGPDSPQGKGIFSDVLQAINEDISGGLELDTSLLTTDLQAQPLPGQLPDPTSLTPLNAGFGQWAPGQTIPSQWPVHGAGFSQSLEPTGPILPSQAAVGQPLPGPAQALAVVPGQAQALGKLDDYVWSQAGLSSTHNPLDPNQLQQQLAMTAPVNADPQMVAGGTGGVKVPLSGNLLPAEAFRNQLTQSTIPNTTPTTVGLASERLAPLTMADHAAALHQEAFKAAPEGAALTKPAMPEAVAPFAALFKPAMTSSGPATTSSSPPAIAEIKATLTDGDTAQVDGLRNLTSTSPLERAPLTQAPVAPIALTRMAGAPGWDQGLGQRILWMVDNGLSRAEMRLDPPHLGSVNVRISMADDQAQLVFQAQHPAAREALEAALPKLREMFNQQGLELADADISDNSSSGESGREAHDSASSQWASNHAQTDANDLQEDAVSAASTTLKPVSSSSLVDEFV